MHCVAPFSISRLLRLFFLCVCWIARVRQLYEEMCSLQECPVSQQAPFPCSISQRYAFRVQMSRDDLPRSKLYISYTYSLSSTAPYPLVTSSICPPCPPPLFPSLTVKPPFPQLLVNLIMRLAHPSSQTSSPFHPRLVSPSAHPFLKVLRARPARV